MPIDEYETNSERKRALIERSKELRERHRVGDTQDLRCELCEETTEHYLYHDGTWVCVECGE